jgi:hypothetical protein
MNKHALIEHALSYLTEVDAQAIRAFLQSGHLDFGPDSRHAVLGRLSLRPQGHTKATVWDICCFAMQGKLESASVLLINLAGFVANIAIMPAGAWSPVFGAQGLPENWADLNYFSKWAVAYKREYAWLEENGFHLPMIYRI